MKDKILVIGHIANRTGAPIILINFLQWIKLNTNLSLEIILKSGGELIDDYKELGDVVLWDSLKLKNTKNKRKYSLLRKINPKIEKYLLKKYIKRKKLSGIKLIYSNTIVNGEILKELSILKCPILCHVHELESEIKRAGPANIKYIKSYVTHYIAASDAVKQNLMNKHKIREDKIDVVHEFINISEMKLKKNILRKKYNIPDNAFVVGGSGYGTLWRKGKDLFIQLAHTVLNKSNDSRIYFIWLGGSENSQEMFEVEHDIHLAGLIKYVKFIESKPNPLDYFQMFDVFALLSREDSFPIACLEAAYLGKPILCFESAGGMQEFVEHDAGFVVPYINIDIMADKVELLIKDKDLRKRLGERALEKVCERHDISLAAPMIYKIINEKIIRKRMTNNCNQKK